MIRRALVALLVLPVLMSCGSPPAAVPGPADPAIGSATAPSGQVARPGQTIQVDLAGRPFQLHMPTGFVPGRPLPLVVLLHGYRASGSVQEQYLKLTGESDRRGFLYATPDGTKDRAGNRFWNATDACCNFYQSTVDDSAYLSELIAAVKASYPVDPGRVFLIGHSNGGFMAHRMACDHADDVTAIVSLAGAMWSDATRCSPSRPVSVLQIHGTDDKTIRYAGGSNVGHPYPGASTTAADWQRLNGCAASASDGPRRDLVTDVRGAETTTRTYRSRCLGGSRVELWTMTGAPHIPAIGQAFAGAVLDFLQV